MHHIALLLCLKHFNAPHRPATMLKTFLFFSKTFHYYYYTLTFFFIHIFIPLSHYITHSPHHHAFLKILLHTYYIHYSLFHFYYPPLSSPISLKFIFFFTLFFHFLFLNYTLTFFYTYFHPTTTLHDTFTTT